jgi:hypothetical protein
LPFVFPPLVPVPFVEVSTTRPPHDAEAMATAITSVVPRTRTTPSL